MYFSQTRIQCTPYTTPEYTDAHFCQWPSQIVLLFGGHRNLCGGFLVVVWVIVGVSVVVRVPVSHISRYVLVDRATDAYSL